MSRLHNPEQKLKKRKQKQKQETEHRIYYKITAKKKCHILFMENLIYKVCFGFVLKYR